MVQSAEDGINQQPKPVYDGEVYLHRNSYEFLTRVDSERAETIWYHTDLSGLTDARPTATSTPSGTRYLMPEAVACA